jgi:hypothetical protein
MPLCGAQEGFMSIGMQKAFDVSDLSDAIIALTFLEIAGELRRAFAVVKKNRGCISVLMSAKNKRWGAVCPDLMS